MIAVPGLYYGGGHDRRFWKELANRASVALQRPGSEALAIQQVLAAWERGDYALCIGLTRSMVMRH